MRINFEFCIIMRKNICNAVFLANKISNSIVNGIIYFRTKYTKFLIPSQALINPFASSNLIHNGFKPNNVLYKMS